jgi:hypothetical protein
MYEMTNDRDIWGYKAGVSGDVKGVADDLCANYAGGFEGVTAGRCI